MCSVPPKFFQVCRLCLMLIDENDISAHKIYSTTSVPKDFCKECKCNFHNDANFKCCSKDIKCKSCDNYRMNKNEPDHTWIQKTFPRVPLSHASSSQAFASNKQYAEEQNTNNSKEHINTKAKWSELETYSNLEDKLLSTQKDYCKVARCGEEISNQNELDDSAPHIVIQILSCLSLEVSLKSSLRNKSCLLAYLNGYQRKRIVSPYGEFV